MSSGHASWAMPSHYTLSFAASCLTNIPSRANPVHSITTGGASPPYPLPSTHPNNPTLPCKNDPCVCIHSSQVAHPAAPALVQPLTDTFSTAPPRLEPPFPSLPSCSATPNPLPCVKATRAPPSHGLCTLCINPIVYCITLITPLPCVKATRAPPTVCMIWCI